ncbi:MAG: hypothetical protein R2824_25555 [Saprospiraceae bacterium]|nr:hypothetical protein [Lewinella sp.]
MSTYRFPLHFTPVGKWACLRELCGQDLLSIHHTGTIDAIRLLDGLLVEGGETGIGTGMAAAIATADRDQLLMAIYKQAFGDRVETTISCEVCGEPMDLSFTLDDLFHHLRAKDKAVTVRSNEDGTFRLPEGCRFRMPTGEDERLVRGMPPDQAEQLLMERCLLEGDPDKHKVSVQQAMDQIAPVFETSLLVNCPECGHSQQLYFDLQTYLLANLELEKEQLPLEVHRLTMAYGWSHQEIMSLPRSLRRRYLSLILAEYG